jgi:hypothetical protein
MERGTFPLLDRPRRKFGPIGVALAASGSTAAEGSSGPRTASTPAARSRARRSSSSVVTVAGTTAAPRRRPTHRPAAPTPSLTATSTRRAAPSSSSTARNGSTAARDSSPTANAAGETRAEEDGERPDVTPSRRPPRRRRPLRGSSHSSGSPHGPTARTSRGRHRRARHPVALSGAPMTLTPEGRRIRWRGRSRHRRSR